MKTQTANKKAAPQTGAGSIDERQYSRLLRHTRRLLWHDVTAGDLPSGAIDPRTVVDAAVQTALTAPETKPEKLNQGLWLYLLTRRELTRRRNTWREQRESHVSLDEVEHVADDSDEADGHDAEHPLDIIERQLEPPVVERREVTPDPGTPSPAEYVASRELLSELRRATSRWPAELREIFELHFVEGLEGREIAKIVSQTTAEIEPLLEEIQRRVREEVVQQAWV